LLVSEYDLSGDAHSDIRIAERVKILDTKSFKLD
jgi:hypothetical protein